MKLILSEHYLSVPMTSVEVEGWITQRLLDGQEGKQTYLRRTFWLVFGTSMQREQVTEQVSYFLDFLLILKAKFLSS